MTRNVDRDEIAKLAGVSSATVSRVFNHPEKVSSEKRKLVLKIAEKHHYKPNFNASLLARGINGKILLLDNNKLLKYDKKNSYYYSWLYVDLLNKIRASLINTYYDLVISNLDDLKISNPDSLREFDGIICFDIDTAADLNLVIKSKVPYVYGHHVKNIPLKNGIYTDNFYGGYLQARYLKETGHKNPIYITGQLDLVNPHKERLEGFKQVYSEKDICLITGFVGKDGGSFSIRKVIPQIKSGQYDSIAAVNDLTAIGIYFELLNNGIHVPDDISIIGYDNLPFTNLLPSRLSTIDIGIGQLYKQTADHLLKMINNKENDLDNCYRPTLVRGETVKFR